MIVKNPLLKILRLSTLDDYTQEHTQHKNLGDITYVTFCLLLRDCNNLSRNINRLK